MIAPVTLTRTLPSHRAQSTAAVRATSHESRTDRPDLTSPVRVTWTEMPAPLALGRSPLDGAALAASPSLRHIDRAISGSNLRAQDLFNERNLSFRDAPDPTAHLQQTHRANAQRPVTGGEELRVMSYNVALLDLPVDLEDVMLGIPGLNALYVVLFPLLFWFKFITVKHPQSPLLEERKPQLPDMIFGTGDHVVMLQEVWRQKDAEWFTEQARARGYVAITTPRSEHNDGLMTFVRRDAVDARAPVEASARAYAAQDWQEGIAHVERGYQRVRFTHPTLGPLTVFNTHMQAYPDAWMNRMEQSRELGLAAREAQRRDPNGVVLLGGDLNSGPFYATDRWDDGKEGVPDFYRNAIAYGLLEHYSGLSDVVVAGRSASEADDDVELARTPPRSGDQPRYPFTADAGSNSLYERQYHNGEPPARLDHLRANTAGGRIHVVSSEMAFTGDIQAGNERVEPSDHYALRATLRIARPRSQRAITRKMLGEAPAQPLQLRPAS